MTLQELKAQEAELNALLKENHDKQLEINIKLFIEKHGFEIGDTIEYADGGKTKQAIIAYLEKDRYSPNIGYYYVYPILKDGTAGMSRRLYSPSSAKIVQKAAKK